MEIQTNQHQIEIYRAMTPEEKYKAIKSLIDTGRAMKHAYFHSLHPEWTEEHIQKALRDWFLYART